MIDWTNERTIERASEWTNKRVTMWLMKIDRYDYLNLNLKYILKCYWFLI